MKAKAFIEVFCGLFGLALIWLALMTAAGRIPVPTLYKMKDERKYRKELRWHSISYGCIGMLALLDCICFFFPWNWAIRLKSSLNIVLTLYLLYTLSFRIYRKGWWAGD